MATFDPSSVFGSIQSFFGESDNRDAYSRLWEAYSRIFEDDTYTAQQLNASKSLATCPAYIVHNYHHMDLSNWYSTGAYHQHYNESQTAAANQQTFYLNGFVDPTTVSVYFDGIARPTTDYRIYQDLDQSTTGSILSAKSPLASTTDVLIFADHQLYYEVVETSLVSTQVLFSAGWIDPVAATVNLFQKEITNEIDTVVANYVSSTKISFYAGATIKIVDGDGSIQYRPVTVTSNRVTTSPVLSDPNNTRIYQWYNLDVTPDFADVSGSVLTFSRTVPPGIRVTIDDTVHRESVLLDAPSTGCNLQFNYASTASIYLDGVDVENVLVTSGGYTLTRPIPTPVTVLFAAPYIEQHDHLLCRTIISGTPTSDILVSTTHPFTVSHAAGGVIYQHANYPIRVFVDGVLQTGDDWYFNVSTPTQAITLTSPVSDATVDIFYVSHEDDSFHLHTTDIVSATAGRSYYSLSTPASSHYPIEVYANGIMIYSGAELCTSSLIYVPPTVGALNLTIMHTNYRLPVGHSIDPYILSAATMRDGIDAYSATMLGGYTVDLYNGLSGFMLCSGTLEATVALSAAWFSDIVVNEETAWTNFGYLIGYKDDNSPAYANMVQALFAAYIGPTTDEAVENHSCILLGSEYTKYFGSSVTTSGDYAIAYAPERTAFYMSPDMGRRLPIGKNTVPAFWAFSQCAELLYPASAMEHLPQLAEQVGVDYDLGHLLDSHTPYVLSGGGTQVTFIIYGADQSMTNTMYDPAADFSAGEVWVGDLAIGLFSTVTLYASVIEVIDKNRLKINFAPSVQEYGFGEDSFGTETYGGYAFITTCDQYKIYTRRTRTLSYMRLDCPTEEENTILASALVPLFANVRLLKIDQDALINQQHLDELSLFLDNVRPAGTMIIPYSDFYANIEESINIGAADHGVTLTYDRPVFIAGISPIGATGTAMGACIPPN